MAKNVSTVNNKRHKLYQEIPLSTPYMLYINPSNVCNFKCRFCAMSTGEKQSYKKQTMPFELYKKIIDDLSKFPERLKMIRLVAHGEPLLNPHFTDMVRYTKKAGVCNWIETITNGSRLTPELNDEFAASGLDRIRISVEAPTEEGYKETAGVDIDMEKFTENIRDLYKKC